MGEGGQTDLRLGLELVQAELQRKQGRFSSHLVRPVCKQSD